MGERAGCRVFRIGAEDDAPWVTSSVPLQAHLDGFDLHAAVAVEAGDRDRLERLCRYVLRPTVVEDRVELREDGKVLLELKRPFREGTTHLFFKPLELLEKIAAAFPRPRVNQLIYAGVLGPKAKMRRAVTAYGRALDTRGDPLEGAGEGADDGERDTEPLEERRRSYTWAELMARAFLIDVLDCPRCHGRMRVISTIEDPKVIRRILEHLGLPTEIPSPAPARSRFLGDDGVVYDLDGW